MARCHAADGMADQQAEAYSAGLKLCQQGSKSKDRCAGRLLALLNIAFNSAMRLSLALLGGKDESTWQTVWKWNC